MSSFTILRRRIPFIRRQNGIFVQAATAAATYDVIVIVAGLYLLAAALIARTSPYQTNTSVTYDFVRSPSASFFQSLLSGLFFWPQLRLLLRQHRRNAKRQRTTIYAWYNRTTDTSLIDYSVPHWRKPLTMHGPAWRDPVVLPFNMYIHAHVTRTLLYNNCEAALISIVTAAVIVSRGRAPRLFAN